MSCRCPSQMLSDSPAHQPPSWRPSVSKPLRNKNQTKRVALGSTFRHIYFKAHFLHGAALCLFTFCSDSQMHLLFNRINIEHKYTNWAFENWLAVNTTGNTAKRMWNVHVTSQKYLQIHKYDHMFMHMHVFSNFNVSISVQVQTLIILNIHSAKCLINCQWGLIVTYLGIKCT